MNYKENFKLNSKKLSESRQRSAIKLSEQINKELPYLKLENANFEIKFEEIDFENCSIDGIDKVIFFASTNTGMDKKPINKIASGGELSRFLLAIKFVLETEMQNRKRKEKRIACFQEGWQHAPCPRQHLRLSRPPLAAGPRRRRPDPWLPVVAQEPA